MDLLYINYSLGALVFVLSVALQATGGVLLLVENVFSGSVEEQIKRIVRNRPTIGEHDGIGICQERRRELVDKIWKERFTFTYLILGFTLILFSEPLSNSFGTPLACFLFLCLALFLLAYVASLTAMVQHEGHIKFEKKITTLPFRPSLMKLNVGSFAISCCMGILVQPE